MNSKHFDQKILIVDDMDYNCMLITEILKAEGYTNVSSVNSGTAALEEIEKSQPSLVITELALRDIDGLEIIKSIQEKKKHRYISCIVQTESTDPARRQRAFHAGANDFIKKPIDKAELISRVKLQLDQRDMYMDLLEAHNRMSTELQDASKMLFSMLPTQQDLSKIANDHSISIATYYKPSSELGGDFYDIFKIDENRVGFYMWDFAGHGVGAAINTFRLNSVLRDYKEYTSDPGRFLTKLNGIMYNMLPRNQYATMFFGILDLKERKLRYSCASCPTPILICGKEMKSDGINARGFPLGIQDQIPYETQEIDVKGWNALLLYSDALTETPDAANNMFKVDYVMDLLGNNAVENGNVSAEKLKENILSKFLTKHAEYLTDDLTLQIISF